MDDKQSMRRAVGEWLLGGGALLALITGIIGYFSTADNRQLELRRDACSHAHAAIVDDGLNPALSNAEQRAYLASQLKVAADCDREAGYE